MTPFYDSADFTLYVGDVLEQLAHLEDGSVDCVVTSPPYWGLRDYGTGSWVGGNPDCDHVRDVRKYADGCVGCGVAMQHVTPGCGHCADRHAKRRKHGTPLGRNYETPPEDHWERPRARDQVTQAAQVFTDVCGKCGAQRQDHQLGLEPTPDQYVANMVAVFREIRRVLADHGTCWVNLGDSYAASAGGDTKSGFNSRYHGKAFRTDKQAATAGAFPQIDRLGAGLKPKDLVGIPWRVAFALQQDGWYLRADVIWAKPNPMPESVTDRPTKAHEYVFLLSKRPRYWFDQEAVREAADHFDGFRGSLGAKSGANGDRNDGGRANVPPTSTGRNVRSVWEARENLVRMRSDLSDVDRSYVLGELAKRGLLESQE